MQVKKEQPVWDTNGLCLRDASKRGEEAFLGHQSQIERITLLFILSLCFLASLGKAWTGTTSCGKVKSCGSHASLLLFPTLLRALIDASLFQTVITEVSHKDPVSLWHPRKDMAGHFNNLSVEENNTGLEKVYGI